MGGGYFRDTKSKMNVALLVQRVTAQVLKREIRRCIVYDVELEKDVKELIKSLTREATNWQSYANDSDNTSKTFRDNGSGKRKINPYNTNSGCL